MTQGEWFIQRVKVNLILGIDDIISTVVPKNRLTCFEFVYKMMQLFNDSNNSHPAF